MTPLGTSATPLHSVLDWGRQSMCSIVQRMLENADDALFSMAEVTHSNQERSGFFDSMRHLRKIAPVLVREFRAGLTPGSRVIVASEDVELTLLHDSAVEEDIAISRIVARVESVAKNSLWEFNLRSENISGLDSLRGAFEKLRPAEAAQSFHYALTAASVDSSTKLILFKLYERQILADSHAFYGGMNLRLEASGITSKTLLRRTSGRASLNPVVQSSDSSTEVFAPSHPVAPAPSYHLPSSLRSALAPLFAAPSGYEGGAIGATGPHDPLCNTGPAHAPAAVAQIDFNSQGSLQRISLINQLLGEMGRDWKSGEVDALRSLLLPLARIALADSRFFVDQHHPVRELLSALGVPDADRNSKIQDIRSTLQAMQSEVILTEAVEPLPFDDLHRFLISQRAPRHTTLARMEEARQSAHAQIKSVGSGRDLPAGMSAFLTQIWLPLVSAIHLRFGAASTEVDRTTRLLERLFGECRWVPRMSDPKMIDQILTDLDSEMRQMAVPPSLIAKAQHVLQEGIALGAESLLDLETFTQRDHLATDPSSTGAAQQSAHTYPGDMASWRSALPTGSWFRIFDRSNHNTQWLSSGVLYPQSISLSFSGFDPEVKLTIERLLFLQDLVDGKAEAVDPTEMQQSSIRLLCLEFTRTKVERNAGP